MRHSRIVLALAAIGLAAAAEAQDDEPDLSFLEYLGSWQESDEEWLIVAEMDDELTDEDEAPIDDAASVKDKDTGETDDTDEK
jgi:hypothetical protein